MEIKEIIDGLKFTVEMFLFDPSTGEVLTKNQLNADNRTTVDACEGAIKLLKDIEIYEKLIRTSSRAKYDFENLKASRYGVKFIEVQKQRKA